MAIVTAQAPLPTTPPPVSNPAAEKLTAAPVEGVQEETTAEEKPLSPQFAALARKEKDLRRMQQEIAAEKAKITAKEEEYKTKYIPKDRLTGSTLETLLENGITYEQIASMALNQPSQETQAIAELKRELAALRDEHKQSLSKSEEQQASAYQNAVNQIRNEAKILIDSDAEYETIKATDSVEKVVQYIEETYKTEGVVKTVQEAAKFVEEELLEQALKFAGLNKVKAKLAPQEQTIEAQKLAPTKQSQTTQTIKTLTNAGTATTSKPLSSRERRERAIAICEGRV